MKVVILAGGLGSRLSEHTKTMPKPMVKINGIPIILRLMSHYSKYGFKQFFIATGYKGNVIKTPYSYKNSKGHSQPPSKALDKWVVRKGIAPRDASGN